MALRFLAGGLSEGFVANLAEDADMKLLAECIITQQQAGFRDLADLRKAACPSCRANGFNTGFGYFKFTCGAEICGDEWSEECPRAAPLPAQTEARDGG